MRAMPLAADTLVVDIGNSKALAVLYTGGRERRRWRLVFEGRDPAWVRAAWRAVLGAAGGVPIRVASVVPAALRALTAAAGRRRTPLHVVRWTDRWPFEIAVRNPDRVGIDRLANVAGMRALGWQSGVAVDAGTAITIDVLRAGRFEGGLILPGFDTMLQALHQRTAQLPALVLRAPAPLLGRDTASALRAGAYHTIHRGVVSTVRALAAALGPGARVAVTGGRGEWFADAWPECGHLEPDLLLGGLRCLPLPRPQPRPPIIA